jgi:hydrogenase nickel incorporation protein HypA/HybF
MFEFEYAREFVEQCENHVRTNEAEKVLSVTVKVGTYADVNTEKLQEEFERFKVGTVCDQATLIIEIERIKLYCQSCFHEEEMDDLALECPACGSDRTAIIGGEEVYLMQLEME